MTTRAKLTAGILCTMLVAPLLGLGGGQGPAAHTPRPTVTRDDFVKMMHDVSNWGRWGKDDQLGAINFITPQKRKEAAALVKEGASVSLAHDTLTVKVSGTEPFGHKMISTGLSPESHGATDEYSVAYHGFTVTHMDSLCHFFFEGKMYNGYPQQEVTEQGAGKLAVTNFKNGIFTRGVLMDFPRLWGAKYLQGNQRIYPEDLDAWEKSTGVKIQSGDAVLIRTGRWGKYEAEGDWNASQGSAGLDVTCMPWFKKRDVAVMGSDLALDAMPPGIEGVTMPVHIMTIVAMGTPILDNLDLESVGKAAAERKRWTFLLTAAPLPVVGGTGSPLNPIATF